MRWTMLKLTLSCVLPLILIRRRSLHWLPLARLVLILGRLTIWPSMDWLLRWPWSSVLLMLLALQRPLAVSLHRRCWSWWRRGIALLLSIVILTHGRLNPILLWFRRRPWGVFELSEIWVKRIVLSLRPRRHVFRRRWYVNALRGICICREIGRYTLSRQRRRYFLLAIILTICTRRRQGNARMLSLRRWKV